MAVRNRDPIALGTWGKRSRRTPRVAEEDFKPVDTAPAGSLGNDMMWTQTRSWDDTRNGVSPGVAFTRMALRTVGNYRREQKRQQPRWSVRQTGVAAGALLDAVADYCMAHRAYDLATETSLAAAVPGLLTRCEYSMPLAST